MGKATGEKAYNRGAKVVFSSRTLAKLNKVVEGKDKTRAFAVQCDAGDVKQLKTAVDKAAELMGGIDGILWIPTYIGEESFLTIDQIFEKDLIHTAVSNQMRWNIELFLEFFKFSLPHLKKNKVSHVATVGSLASYMPGKQIMFAYGMSKRALEHTVGHLAQMYAKDGIRVNCFNSGLFKTEIFQAFGMSNDESEKFLAKTHWRIPFGRPGTESEAGEFCAFLLSHRSSYMTGESMRADGGFMGQTYMDDIFGTPKIMQFVEPTKQEL